MIVHGTCQAAPEPGQPADGPVREVAVEATTYEAARTMLYEQVRDGERLTGIRVEGRPSQPDRRTRTRLAPVLVAAGTLTQTTPRPHPPGGRGSSRLGSATLDSVGPQPYPPLPSLAGEVFPG